MEDKQIINSESRLLSFEENEVVFRLLGSKCKSRSTAVVQLYATMPPNHDSWEYQFCGVATFVKDFSRRSFFIQVYDIEKNEILFEQEIYKDFSYSVRPIFFHQFESENTIIGINFADDVEAEHFGTCLLNYVERKQKKKVEMKETKQVTTMDKVSKIKRSGRRSGSRRIRKSQIGHPENFRHIQHVGLDKGDNSPENILSCIIDMSQDKSATLGKPSSQQTTPNPFDEAFAEYSSPKSQSTKKQKAKPQHPNPLNIETRSKHEFDVPPNIPMSSKPQKKSPRLNSTPHSPLPRPPPPPPGQGSKPRIQPPRNQPLFQEHVEKEVNQDSREEEPSSRSDFLSEIRNPKLKLRHEVTQDSGEEEPSSRNDLLSEIRNPKLKLRHVDLEEQKSKQASASTGSNNILETMAKVLEVRGRGVRGDSDDSYSDSSYSGDDDDDDSDDW